MAFLDPLQIEELADAIVAPYGVLIRLAAYTGMLAGEIGAPRRTPRSSPWPGRDRSITVTMNTYGHMFPTLKESVTDGLYRAWRTAHDEKDAAGVARLWHDTPESGGVVVLIGAGHNL